MKTILTLLGILILSPTVFPQNAPGGRLAGTWEVVVTPRVCATGDSITTFKSVFNFNEGGTFTGRSSGTGSGGTGRDQLGVWKHLDGDQYHLKLKAYLFNAANQVFGYQIVTSDITLSQDAQSWSYDGLSQTFNFDDVQTNSGCSTAVATRITLD